MLKSRIETMWGWRSRAQAALAHEALPGARHSGVGEDDLDRDFVAEQRATAR
jgi:hypothetical protein